MGIAAYGARHAQAFLGSLGRLARSPVATALTVFVIGLALALPLGLKLLVANVTAATGGFAGAVNMSVYFKPEVPLERVRLLARNARERTGVAAVSVISSADALAEFRKYSGFGAALQALIDNPLPNVLDVQPTAEGRSPEAIATLERYFQAWPEVDLVQVDTAWVERLDAILDVLEHLLAVTAALLAAGVLAMIGNTVRLEIQNRRAEIEVVKLVGGSNAFVRRPFLYTGMLYGLAGAVLAWCLVALAAAVIAGPVATLARLYGSHYVLAGPALDDALWLLGGGVLLGWLGAWISAARHLRRIEPRA